jgi:peptidylprolyl isomerase
VPKTCENFRCLCTGERGASKRTGKALSFKGTRFHRIANNFMIQGGDITYDNGTGGESIYGGMFEDETFKGKAGRHFPFCLSMANTGPDTNSSQFFITCSAAPWLDGKNVVFGQVTAGRNIVKEVSTLGDSRGRPTKGVFLYAAGQYSDQSGGSAGGLWDCLETLHGTRLAQGGFSGSMKAMNARTGEGLQGGHTRALWDGVKWSSAKGRVVGQPAYMRDAADEGGEERPLTGGARKGHDRFR